MHQVQGETKVVAVRVSVPLTKIDVEKLKSDGKLEIIINFHMVEGGKVEEIRREKRLFNVWKGEHSDKFNYGRRRICQWEGCDLDISWRGHRAKFCLEHSKKNTRKLQKEWRQKRAKKKEMAERDRGRSTIKSESILLRKLKHKGPPRKEDFHISPRSKNFEKDNAVICYLNDQFVDYDADCRGCRRRQTEDEENVYCD